jgi:putative transposase
MPTHLREFEINGVYHIIKRGVEKRRIFLKPQDYSRFILGIELCNMVQSTDLWTLLAGSSPAKIAARLQGKRVSKQQALVDVLEFTLMPNHFHMGLREIKEGGISQYMQKMGGYSTYFNKQYNRVGPLFQSRFKAVHIKDDIQLNNMFVYVHTNPIALWEPGWKDFKVENSKNAMKKLEEYWASSYNDYIGKPKFPYAINREFFLNFYGSEERCRQAVEDWVRFKAAEANLESEIFE